MTTPTMKMKITAYTMMLVLVIIGIQSCVRYYFRSNYQDANSLIHETKNLKTKPFLKAHLKNGDVCILRDSWVVDTTLNFLSGTGTKYDFNRNKVFDGAISIFLTALQSSRQIKKYKIQRRPELQH